jgi:alkylhydroperoxidase family enzyme
MSWINEADPGDQSLPAIFQAMSLNPEALESVKRLNEILAFGNSNLTRLQEEAIATVVAAANHCRYEALTHSGFLCAATPMMENWLAVCWTIIPR